jgi:periplasmic protein CpxP/Spy
MSRTKNLHMAKFLLASGLALGLASPVFAQPPMGAPMPPHGHHSFDGPMFGGPVPFLRDLKLTQAQEDQIFKTFHEQAPAMRERMKEVRRAREELDKAGRTTNFDRARTRELANAVAKAQADIALIHTESMSRVWGILTPEQRARLEERFEKRPPRGPR